MYIYVCETLTGIYSFSKLIFCINQIPFHSIHLKNNSDLIKRFQQDEQITNKSSAFSSKTYFCFQHEDVILLRFY